MAKPPNRIRPPENARDAAAAAFKSATTKPVEPISRPQGLPGVRELVSLRIDQDILEHFREAGPGWQDRINDALRLAVKK